MTPVSFSSFRYRLDTASGFQSFQFRELEYVLGHRRPGVVERIARGERGARAGRASGCGSRASTTPSSGSCRAAATTSRTRSLERDAAGRRSRTSGCAEILVQIYRSDPANRDVCERLVDLDEGLQEWRYRHVKMVQRTIGMKIGTGGSAGVEYLKNTLFTPLFPDLWAIRTELSAPARRPASRRSCRSRRPRGRGEER